MVELSPLVAMGAMFVLLSVLLLSGQHVVFAMGSTGLLLIYLLWGSGHVLFTLVANAIMAMESYTLVAIPLFIFMAMMLRSSGIIEELFHSLRLWLDRVPGGLAMAVILVSVFIGAMSGVVATGIVVLGIVAVPIMLKYGYSKGMAIGPVMAGACLAILIPPSVGFIVYGAIAQVSVGQLFIGGLIPGLILAGIEMIYIGIRCYRNPDLAPMIPPEERVGFREKVASLKALILPLCLIVAVLGSVFFGIACATEAAGIGALGALLIAAGRRKLTWSALKEGTIETGKSSSMLLWIFIGAYCFKSVFVLSGGPSFVSGWVAGLTVAPLAIIGTMQAVFIMLGCFVQEIVIQVICMPIFLPIVTTLGRDYVWFGVLFLTNAQLSFLTPPFGFALFYMRSVLPEDISMADIIRAGLPFIPLQLLVVLLVMFIPQLALWLPSMMLR